MTDTPRASIHKRQARGDRAERLVALVRSTAAGDRTAFAQLYDEISPLVYGTALRVLIDSDLAAELTQDVMLEIWNGAARFDASRGSVTAWVATISHRRAVDRVRAVRAQRERDDWVGTRDLERPRDNVSETAQQHMDEEEVTGCLGSLTSLQREAVLSAYYGGRTYREVAEQVGAALATVKSRIRDGLRRLRQCLEVDQ